TRKALAEATEPLEQAGLKIGELRRRTDDLAINVLSEMADDALATLEATRGDAAAAEARARGLSQMLSARGRQMQSRNEAPGTASLFFRAAEMINARLANMRLPGPAGLEVEAEAARWSETMHRLATDPTANIE